MTKEICNASRRRSSEAGDFPRPTCPPTTENDDVGAVYSQGASSPTNSNAPHLVRDEEAADLAPTLLTVEEAAKYLRVSKNYLDKLRVSGGGPDFARLGRRKVIYRIEDLKSWVAARIYGSTTEYTD